MATRGRNARSGKRETLGGLFVRSSWEHNYCLYLNHLVAVGSVDRWEYEPKVFLFPVKRGNRHYTPDFRVWYADGHYEWHEVKGYMDDASRIKLRRFTLHHPDEAALLTLVDRDAYYRIRDTYGPLLAGWEQ